SFLSSVSMTSVGATFSASNQAPVKVTENAEPNDTEGAATLINKDILYISHISSSTDKDFFKFPVPPVGSRLSVLLSHQTTDGDVILYRPTNISPDLRPSGGIPLQSPPLDDAPP